MSAAPNQNSAALANIDYLISVECFHTAIQRHDYLEVGCSHSHMRS